MGWVTVETPNAVYKVALEWHLRRAVVPKGIDAAILEEVGEPNKLIQDTKKYGIYENVHKNDSPPKPIFHADYQKRNFATTILPDMAKQIMRVFALSIGSTGISPLLFVPSIYLFTIGGGPIFVPGKEIKKRKILLPIAEAIKRMGEGSKTYVHYRDALVAEKAETRVAPYLSRKLGRKPVIAIVYGAGHFGIARLLNKPSERRRILRNKWVRRAALNAVVHTTELEYNRSQKAWTVRDLEPLDIPKHQTFFRRVQARARLARVKTKRAIKRMRK